MEKRITINPFIIKFSLIFILSIFLLTGHALAQEEIWPIIHPLSQIGGHRSCLDVSENYAYISEGVSLRIFDVSGEQPHMVGAIYMPHEPEQIQVIGNYAYVTIANENLLSVVDVSEPANPAILSNCTLSGGTASGGLAISGNYAYVVQEGLPDNPPLMQIINISDPFNPAYIKDVNISATCLCINGTMMYTVGDGALMGYDLSDSLNPQQMGSCSIGSGCQIFIEGVYAYVACGEEGVKVVNISNPEDPTQVGSYCPVGKSCFEVVVQSGLAYIAADDAGLIIADMNNLDNIVTKGGIPEIESTHLHVLPPHAYILASDHPDGLIKADVSDPASPGILGKYQSPTEPLSIEIDGQALYIADANGLWAYDLSDPAIPFLISIFEGRPSLTELFLNESILFGIHENQMSVLNVSNAGNITETSCYQMDDGCVIDDIFFDGGYAYLLTSGTVDIIDLTEPQAPNKINSSLSFSGFIEDIFVADGIACLAVRENENLSIEDDEPISSVIRFDVSNPLEPITLSSITTVGEGQHIFVQDNTLYAVGYTETPDALGTLPVSHIQAFDLTEGELPQPAGHITIEGYIFEDLVAQTVGSLGPVLFCPFLSPLEPDPSLWGGIRPFPYDPGAGTFGGGPQNPSPRPFRLAGGGGSPNSFLVSLDGNMGIHINLLEQEELCCVNTEVYPEAAAQDGCMAVPESVPNMTCNSAVPVAASAGGEWTFDAWTGDVGYVDPNDPNNAVAFAIGKCSIAYANFVRPELYLGTPPPVPGGDVGDIGVIGDTNIPVIEIVLSTNDIDSWDVQTVTFTAFGDGDDATDIGEAILLGGENRTSGTYSGDNGTVIFSVNKTIDPSSSLTLKLFYNFDPANACPCETYKAKITMADVTANAVNYTKYKKIANSVESRQIKRGNEGTLEIIHEYEDAQGIRYGDPNKEMQNPLRVRVTDQDPGCDAVNYGAVFSANGGTQIDVSAHTGNIWGTKLTLGTEMGMTNQYKITASLFSEGTCHQTGVLPPEAFTVCGRGANITLSAQHDATGDADNDIKTFLSEIPATNLFTAEIDMAPPNLTDVTEVTFTIKKGNTTIDTAQVNGTAGNKIYTATFDMSQLDSAVTLEAEAVLANGSTPKTQQSLTAKPLPDWVDILDLLSNSYTKNFNHGSEEYEIAFNYPNDFDWSDLIEGDILLLGGLDNNLDISFDGEADYHIDETSSFGAVIQGSPEILGQQFDIEGTLSGNFDGDFEFQRGTGTLSASTGFDLPEKGISKTFIVYGIPITVAVDVSGHVTIFVNGSAVLNDKIEIEQATITPGITVVGDITASISVALGLAKLSVIGNPTVNVAIRIQYRSTAGTTTAWGGEVELPISIVGSLFWFISGELYSTTLGPYPFGTYPLSRKRAIRLASGPILPNFYTSSSLAIDDQDNRMIVWVHNTDPDNPDTPNPEVYYRFYDGQNWTDSESIIGVAGPNQEWEMDPSVVFMSGEKALAAWTTNDGNHTLDDLNDILPLQDIAYAVWNGTSWSAPDHIIDDNEADGAVCLAYDSLNNKVMAVWLHNTNSADDFSVNTEWKLLYSVFEAASANWSSPQVLPTTDQGSADCMAALDFNDSGKGLILWVKDVDGAFQEELTGIQGGTNVNYTNPDCDIYWSKWDGAAWSTPLVLTEANQSTEQSPAVRFAPDGRALAVWVERAGTQNRLFYSIYTPTLDAWSTPEQIIEDRFIEGPSVQIDNNNRATVVYRGSTDIFSMSIDMDTIGQSLPRLRDSMGNSRGYIDINGWSSNNPLTHDQTIDWSFTAALDSSGELYVLWSKFDATSGTQSSGSGLADSLNMAQSDPGTASLTGNYSDQGTDADGDNLYNFLTVSVEVDVLEPGNYQIMAELHKTDKICTATAAADGLSSGPHVFELHFPGAVISDRKIDGPYSLKNVYVLDRNDSAVVTAYEETPYITNAYTFEQFEQGTLSFNEDVYQGTLDTALITIEDNARNTDSTCPQTFTVQVVSTVDYNGITVALHETGNDTGIFSGHLQFSFLESNPASGLIKVSDHSTIQVLYYDENLSYQWLASSVWCEGSNQPPYTEGHSPAKDAAEVAVNANIVVHIADREEGVDATCIGMRVNGNQVTPLITGGPADYTLTYDPDNDFGYEKVIEVSITACDLAGNAMSKDVYSFSTVSDPLNIYNIDIAFTSGLNIFGYPLSIPSGYTSYDLVNALRTETEVVKIQRYDPDSQTYKTTTCDSNGTPGGDIFDIVSGEGYLVYMKMDKSVSFSGAIINPAISCKKGLNIISIPNPPSQYCSYELLSYLGTQEEITSIQRFNRGMGIFETTNYCYGQPSGIKFNIVKGEAYLIHMKTAKDKAPPSAGQ